jgi:hypothetical protein
MDAFGAIEAGICLFLLFFVFYHLRDYFRSILVKISPKTKRHLDSIKNPGETYEGAIRRIIGGRS